MVLLESFPHHVTLVDLQKTLQIQRNTQKILLKEPVEDLVTNQTAFMLHTYMEVLPCAIRFFQEGTIDSLFFKQ